MGPNRLLATFCLILVWHAMGLRSNIQGPAMIDLTLLFHSNYENIGRSLAGGGIGGIIGSILQFIIMDKLEGRLYLSVSAALVIDGVMLILIPLVRNLTALFWFCFFLNSTLIVINTAGQSILILIWKENVGTPVHALHAGFGLGGVLIPLIVNPFLAVLQYDTTMNTTNNGSSQLTSKTFSQPALLNSTPSHRLSDKAVVIVESRVQYAYFIVAGFSILLAVVFAILQIIEWKSQNSWKDQQMASVTHSFKTCRDIFNPVTYTGGSLVYSLSIFFLLLMYYANLVGGMLMFGTFVRSFSVDRLQFSKDNASYLNMVYWLGFAVGGSIGSLNAHFINIKTLILVEAGLNLACIIALNVLSADNSTMLWVFTTVQGILSGPLYPSGIAFANTFMNVSGSVLAFISLGGSLGLFLYIWVTGVVYEKHGPRAILYVFLVSGFAILLSVIIFVVLSYKHKRSLANRRKETENESDITVTESLGATELIPVNEQKMRI